MVLKSITKKKTIETIKQEMSNLLQENDVEEQCQQPSGSHAYNSPLRGHY